ncbi:MAG: alpha/beta hydrolase fold domain-containing protein [Pirellula sp.]
MTKRIVSMRFTQPIGLVALGLIGVCMGQEASSDKVPVGKMVFEEDFQKGRSRWETTDDASWEILQKDGNSTFGLNKRISNYQPKVRSPHNIALIKDLSAGDVQISFRVRSTHDTGNHRDCCVFFGYQDKEHFYYVHLGAKPDPASGQIMIVNGEPRRPLTQNQNTIPWDDKWHRVKVIRRVSSGSIEVYFDDMDRPIMEASDKTFGAGRIGIGSFDDQNEFDDIRIEQFDAGAKPTAKNTEKKAPQRPTPTVSDYVYANDSVRQTFDFWKADSPKPTPAVLLIHGGGWKNGDKTGYGNSPIKKYLQEGISVAAINYRFIQQAMEQGVEPPVKAPLMDAARALQTIRSKAQEWNIDPSRIGATGSSAGACTSLWLALHDDLADPNSTDPIARESTRLTCAAVVGAQTSLDPKQLREWIGNSVYGGHAFGFAVEGRSRDQEFELLLANREKVLPWIRQYSPIEWVSKDDPPIFLEYPKQQKEPVLGGKEPDPTHSAMYGIQLQAACKAAGSHCELVYPGNKESEFSDSQAFLIHHLKRPN